MSEVANDTSLLRKRNGYDNDDDTHNSDDWKNIPGGRKSSAPDDDPWYEGYRPETIQTRVQAMSRFDWLVTLLPCTVWLKAYKWRVDLPADLMAGLAVGLTLIPQSLSYAKIAGLPVQWGLYTGLVPLYAYALYGTSRQLQVGPVAIVSLLVANGVGDVFDKQGLDLKKDAYLYGILVTQITFFVGLVYLVTGLLRGGCVTIFLSQAVTSGFTTGAAVIILLQQLKSIFGYDIGRPETVQAAIKAIIDGISKFQYQTFLMGTFSVLYLMGCKFLSKKYARLKWLRAVGPLSLTIIAIILVVAFDLPDHHIPIVKTIPAGFPPTTFSDWFPVQDFGSLVVPIITISIIGFMESIAIAKQLASKNNYEVDPSRELVALGVANLFGAGFHAYPSAGSFSRSAINNDAGAVSQMAGVVAATLVGLVLLCLTPVFEKMPQNTLAAIVIAGVIGLMDYEEAIRLYKVHKLDCLVWLASCFGVLFAGIEIGLGIGVGSSLLVVVYESANPHTSVLGRLPGTTSYRNIKKFPEAEIYDGVIIVRIEGPLYFANAQKFRDMIDKAQRQAELDTARSHSEIKFVVLDMSPVSEIDSTALHHLETILGSYRARGQQLCFADTARRVVDRLEAAGLVEKIGDRFFFPSLHDAVAFSVREIEFGEHESGLEKKVVDNSADVSDDEVPGLEKKVVDNSADVSDDEVNA